MGGCWCIERQEELELGDLAGEATGQTIKETVGQTAGQTAVKPLDFDELKEELVTMEQTVGQTAGQTAVKTLDFDELKEELVTMEQTVGQTAGQTTVKTLDFDELKEELVTMEQTVGQTAGQTAVKPLDFDELKEELVTMEQTVGQTAGQTAVKTLDFDELKEELVTMEKRTSWCDICLYKDTESVSKWEVMRAVRKVEGVYICYGCELTLCENCVEGHESHKLCVHKESEERERMGEKLINILMKERRRMDKLEEENVSIYDRVNVKHELDKKEDCVITGLCGLDNRRWVVCDYRNDCIKIFQCGSNVLLRYVRIGSKPRDVTEIQVKQNSTVPDSASSSSSDISVTNSIKSDKQCLLAVTLPWECHILFIDVNKTPAIKVKTIKMEKQCYRIEFCDDKIFTLCDEDLSLYGYHWSVYVMSTDGVHLSTIQTGVYRGPWSDLAVVPGRFYVNGYRNHKVKCIRVDGRVISEITIERSGPYGISVDPDHNVYISARHHYKIYKLDFDLDGPPRPLLLDQSTDYMERPRALCFYWDKLFVGHDLASPLRNIVTVVRLV